MYGNEAAALSHHSSPHNKHTVYAGSVALKRFSAHSLPTFTMLYVYLQSTQTLGCQLSALQCSSKHPASAGSAQVLVHVERARKNPAAAKDAQRTKVQRKARVPAHSQARLEDRFETVQAYAGQHART